MKNFGNDMYRRPWRDSSARRLLFIAPFLVGLLSLGSGVAQATAPQDVFNNFNSGAVSNSPTTATVFTIKDSYLITMILDYHWNNGHGSPGGTIALRSSHGPLYGPWRVVTSGGSGAPNINWTAQPKVVVPAGAYTVVDSSPATWSQDAESGGAGFSEVKGTIETSPPAKPGATWSVVSARTLPPMIGVTCPTSSFCIATGQKGTILTTANAGLTWTQRPSGTHYNLNASTCPTSTDCIAVGALGAGIILTSSNRGATWTTRWTASSTSVNAVTCSNARDCIAVGYPGLILTTSNGGTTWTGRSNPLSPYPQSLSDVVCPTSRNCIVVGFDIMTTANGGATWTERTKGGGYTEIACRTSRNCLVAGEQNAATTDQGKTWTVPMKRYTYDGGKTWMTYPPIYSGAISCTNAGGACLMLSTGSTLWKSGDGGVTWVMVWKPPYWLSTFVCPSTKICLAVGKPDAMSSRGVIVREKGGW